MPAEPVTEHRHRFKGVMEVFWRFLALGSVSFGGPAAHIGYFRNLFVTKLGWIDDSAYGRLIALSQFLPGPGSSQIGFALGLRRAGLAGGIAAFLGFTLPSFLLLYLLAIYSPGDHGPGWFQGVVHGLKLFAVVIVADASLSMFTAFCRDRLSISLMVLTTASLLLFPSLWSQLGVLIISAIGGAMFGKKKTVEIGPQRGLRGVPLIIFAGLFLILPLLGTQLEWVALFSGFYQAGSLVFGGGHVVLPLLQQTLGDALPNDRFLLGYAAAQGVPGPMFSLAAFLGAESLSGQGFLGAVLATLGIFLPGFLLVLGLQDAWEGLAARPLISSAAAGINASVVGLLLAALYQPVFTSAVSSAAEMALAVLGFFALRTLKFPVVILVGIFAVLGGLLG
ncbi:MAG: chromate efflux transporter [Gammaproteobacteria bacterium]|nr:chromate efflux transporter [Gammaproteobacteria bacterium]